jgi:3-oxoacyl-[acyl-carrier protein] reductase
MAAALVTGASRGIGRAVALRLAEDGYDISVGYARNRAGAQDVASRVRSAGRRALVVGGDLAKAETSRELVESTVAELGPVQVLVANAGIAADPTAASEIASEDWDRILAVNLRAPFLLAQQVFPGMCERGLGRIVFISSVAAYTGGLIGAHYAASKAGLHGLAHSLAREGAAHGVTVNSVAPALIESDMMPKDPDLRERLAASRAVGRLGRPEEVADLVAAVVRNGYLTNQSIVLDGGTHPT